MHYSHAQAIRMPSPSSVKAGKMHTSPRQTSILGSICYMNSLIGSCVLLCHQNICFVHDGFLLSLCCSLPRISLSTLLKIIEKINFKMDSQKKKLRSSQSFSLFYAVAELVWPHRHGCSALAKPAVPIYIMEIVFCQYPDSFFHKYSSAQIWGQWTLVTVVLLHESSASRRAPREYFIPDLYPSAGCPDHEQQWSISSLSKSRQRLVVASVARPWFPIFIRA